MRYLFYRKKNCHCVEAFRKIQKLQNLCKMKNYLLDIHFEIELKNHKLGFDKMVLEFAPGLRFRKISKNKRRSERAFQMSQKM